MKALKTALSQLNDERTRDAAELKEQEEHRKSVEFRKYLDMVSQRFGEADPDFELPTMREKLAELLEENDNLNKWNDELRAKADKLRDHLDESRNELYRTQQEVIRLQRLLLKNKIDF